MKWRAAAVTDIGRRRYTNEDALCSDAARGLFVVADGMGGHAAGEVASEMAVERVCANFPPRSPEDPDAARAVLVEAFGAANAEILERGELEPDMHGMGTTLTALAVSGDDVVLAHVGDSRAYLLRKDTLTQLTTDHTWVQAQVSAGLLEPEQARFHPFANIITRALGTDLQLEVETLRLPARPGDIFLLCSDGLTGMLSDTQLRDILADEKRTLAVRARRLVQAANRAGGVDNITVVIAKAEASAPPETP
jgi:serine/threonine protein phosphatase PrpC